MTLIEILDELNIPTAPEDHHHCREGWIQTDCPYCSPDTQRWRLGINEQHFYCNCWSCGRHSLTEALSMLSSTQKRDVWQILEQADRRTTKHEQIIGTLKIPSEVGKLEESHKRYLRSRKFNPNEIVRLWGIQGIALSTRLAWRIFIPIHLNGEVVSWTTRSISENVEPRYYSAKLIEEKIHHKKLLYGEDYARHSICVVEGPLDVWSIGPGAVATCGTGLMGDAQVARIAKYPVRYICFDSEREAQKRANKLADDLAVFPGKTTILQFETGKDANSASKSEIKQIRKMLK